MATPDRLSATFSALADPTRRAILARLALGETNVNELAKPFKMSGPAVSKHLKVLEHAGLIARGARRNGVHAALKPPRSSRSTTGSASIAGSGRSGSIGSTIT